MNLSIEELKRVQNMDIMELKREELANAEDIATTIVVNQEERR